MTVQYVVEYTYYQYNSGAADNGNYVRQWPTKSADEAIALARKISVIAKHTKEESLRQEWLVDADPQYSERDKLQDEMIPYMGYFISARAMKITSEPL